MVKFGLVATPTTSSTYDEAEDEMKLHHQNTFKEEDEMKIHQTPVHSGTFISSDKISSDEAKPNFDETSSRLLLRRKCCF